MSLADEKVVLRRTARERIAALDSGQRARADRSICEQLSACAEAIGAASVLGYVALPDEARIDAFLAAAVERGRELLLPSAAGGLIRWLRWTPCTRMARDAEGVLAPAEGTSWKAAGLLLVPGRIFDRRGARVGRGAGYYDRLLAGLGPGSTLVGVGYECQVVDRAPEEEHDRGVQILVTEAGIRRFHREAASH